MKRSGLLVLLLGLAGCASQNHDADINNAYKAYARDSCEQVYQHLSSAARATAPINVSRKSPCCAVYAWNARVCIWMRCRPIPICRSITRIVSTVTAPPRGLRPCASSGITGPPPFGNRSQQSRPAMQLARYDK